MTPDGALLNRDGRHDSDEIRPVFVNDDLNAPDDMGDWWLDLGHLGPLELPA